MSYVAEQLHLDNIPHTHVRDPGAFSAGRWHGAGSRKVDDPVAASGTQNGVYSIKQKTLHTKPKGPQRVKN